MKRVVLLLVMLVMVSVSVSAAWQYEREITINFPASSVAQDGNTPVFGSVDLGRAITDAQLYKNDKTTPVDFNLHTYPGATGCYADGNCLLSFTYFDENVIYIQYNNDTRSNTDAGVKYFGINDGVYAHYKYQELTPLDWAWGRDASSATGTAGSTDCMEGTCLAFGSGDKVTYPFTGAQLGDGTVCWSWELKSEAATQRLLGTGQGGASYAGCYAFDSGGGDYAINCTSDSGAETVQWNMADTVGLVHKICYSWGGSGQFLWGATGDNQLLLRDTGVSTATGNYTSAWEQCQFGSWAGSTCLSESPVDEVVFWDNQITAISDLPGWIEDTNAEQLGLSIGAEVSLGGGGPTITVSLDPNPAYLYPDRGINSITVDLNSSNTPSDGATILDGNWYINGAFYSSDENTTFTSTVRYLDINVTRFARDQNGLSQDDTNLNIRQAPYDLNTLWSPTIPGKNTNADFNSSWDTNGASIAAMLEVIGDQNVLMTSGAFDANVVHVFTTSGNKSLRLHVQNQDTNEQSALFTVAVAGSFQACIIDENYSTPIITANVTANGVAQALDSSACFTYGLGALSPTSNTTISFSADANVGTTEEFLTRVYDFDLNRLSDYDVNFLLVDNNANYVAFEFFDIDEATLLTNTYIQAFYANTSQIAGRRQTNASGEATFYLNPNDPGTIFQVERATGVVWYYTTIVSCLVPRDELDPPTTITPFDIAVGGLGYQDYNGLTTTQTFPILSNTQEFYSATIDDPADNYYSRTYTFATLGDTNSYTLQPYLVDVNDGTVGTITTQDQFTTETIGNILIVLMKNIPGVGNTVVESVESDGTGTAILSYILGDATGYSMLFYDQAGTLLETVFIKPASTAYTANIQQGETTYTTPSFNTGQVPVINIYPNSGTILFTANGVNGFDVNVVGGGTSSVIVRVLQGTRQLDRNAFTGPIGVHFDYNINNLNIDQFLQVEVSVETGDGNYTKNKNFFIDTDGFDLASYTQTLVAGAGELGPGSGPWLTLIIVIMSVSSLAVGFVFGGAAGVGFFVLIAAGFGVLLGFIPVIIWGVMAMGMLGAYLMTRGGG